MKYRLKSESFGVLIGHVTVVFILMLSPQNTVADVSGSCILQLPLAQLPPPTAPGTPTRPIDRQTIIKTVALAAGTLIITFICWYVAYPAILRNGKAWPVSLFGVVTAVAWLSSWLLGLYLFWDKLTISPNDFMKRNGLRILVAAIAVVFAFAWTRLWRSQKRTAK
ncbi:MAG: hypothetical protein ABGZ35_25590 [Planctomycetaceae bacterium]